MRKRCLEFQLQMIFQENDLRKNFLGYVCDMIQDKGEINPIEIDDYNALGVIFRALSYEISVSEIQEDQEFFDLIFIMVSFCKLENGTRVYLGNEISSHVSIFFSRERWLKYYSHLLNKQVKNDNKSEK
jgi:hypothetical protein